MPKPVALTKGEISIGRVPGCDIVLDDPEVSRRHATLRRTPSGYVLVDHDSRNGTFVNGGQITQQALYDEDEIRVGNSVLTVRANQLWVPDTARVRSGSPMLAILAALGALAVVAVLVFLIIDNGDGRGRAVDGVVAVIGGNGTVVGSGVVVDSRGLVLTAYSVLAGDQNPLVGVAVRSDSPPTTWYIAQLQAGDADEDVAVLSLNKTLVGQQLGGPLQLAALRTQDSNMIKEGQDLRVVGYRLPQQPLPEQFLEGMRVQDAVVSRFVPWPDGTRQWIELDRVVDDPVGYRGGAVVTQNDQLVGILLPSPAPMHTSLVRPINDVRGYMDQALRQLGWQ